MQRGDLSGPHRPMSANQNGLSHVLSQELAITMGPLDGRSAKRFESSPCGPTAAPDRPLTPCDVWNSRCMGDELRGQDEQGG